MFRVSRMSYFVFSSSPKTFKKQKIVEFSPKQVFHVIGDVAMYKEFLPYIRDSVVTRRISDTEFEAELGVGFSMFSENYTSKVTLRPDSEITSVAVDSTVFSELLTTWRFAPHPKGCEVDFSISYVVSNPFLKIAIDTSFPEAVEMQVAALERRCASLYPPPVDAEHALHPQDTQRTDAEDKDLVAFNNFVEVFASVRRLAEQTGMSEEAVERAFKESRLLKP